MAVRSKPDSDLRMVPSTGEILDILQNAVKLWWLLNTHLCKHCLGSYTYPDDTVYASLMSQILGVTSWSLSYQQRPCAREDRDLVISLPRASGSMILLKGTREDQRNRRKQSGFISLRVRKGSEEELFGNRSESDS
ncbi:hypothetical protein STEG23_005576, partial [Scotinomys teguina]